MKERNSKCRHQGFVHILLEPEHLSADILCGYCGWTIGTVPFDAADQALQRAHDTGGRVEHRDTKLIVFPRPGAAEMHAPESW